MSKARARFGDTAVATATAADALAIARLQALCFADPWGAAAIARLLAQPATHGVVARAGGEPAGYALFRVAADEGELLSIGVLPERRRSGIGSRVLTGALAGAGRLGARRLFLEVAADNAAACGFYRRHGFAAAGRRTAYYTKGDGSRVDALVLSRDVDG
jgi:ribosomal-protein-alanine N-acetyltransferase